MIEQCKAPLGWGQISWGACVSQDFRARLEILRKNLGWEQEHSSWAMGCMAFESGETFSPSVKNAAGSGATGLIQFMPSTARDLGTTTDALAKMTAVQQLEYVERYFRPYRARISSLSDMYMAILLPKYVGKPDDSILFTNGTVAYRQNAGLDKDRDGKITKLEAASIVQAKWEKGLTGNRATIAPT